ncbi:hypothetical protein F5544_24215 [Nocardia arthritidis]|uniref:Recombinase domain-containing protein n=1 Tax=Nocardia arthritidis TaxID=228602 RepID=A0A6G9YUA5_9NOCA|nr:hypothetical protein F5544_24215 [Nocardia arthritidis]
MGVFAIAQRRTADGVQCPSAYDRQGNRHRCGVAWSKSAVRVILTNPRYTGHEVWNKQRKQESLIDVEDVALGHDTPPDLEPQERLDLLRPARARGIDQHRRVRADSIAPGFTRTTLDRAGDHPPQPSLRLPRTAVPRKLPAAHTGHLEPRQGTLPVPLSFRIRPGKPSRSPTLGISARRPAQRPDRRLAGRSVPP